MVEVSIIMPIFNGENYLNSTLPCILDQTFSDFELICVNDGSSDNTLAILNEFSKNDSRIKIISQKNSGPGVARNNGMKNCNGNFIYFMDYDDYICPEFLELNLNNIKNNDSDFTIFKVGKIKNNKFVNERNYIPFDEIFLDCNFNNFAVDYHSIKENVLNSYFAPWTKFYNKDFLSRYEDFVFNENIAYEDVLFHVKSMLRASKISFVDEILYYYRIDNPNSVTFDDTSMDIYPVVDFVCEFLKNENYFEEFEQEYEFFKTQQITFHMNPLVSEEYFRLAKSYLNDVNLDKNEVIPINLKEKYQIFFESDTPEDYHRVYSIFEEHLNLINERNRLLSIKNCLVSSRSWRYTKGIRMFFQRFRRLR